MFGHITSRSLLEALPSSVRLSWATLRSSWTTTLLSSFTKLFVASVGQFFVFRIRHLSFSTHLYHDCIYPTGRDATTPLTFGTFGRLVSCFWATSNRSSPHGDCIAVGVAYARRLGLARNSAARSPTPGAPAVLYCRHATPHLCGRPLSVSHFFVCTLESIAFYGFYLI